MDSGNRRIDGYADRIMKGWRIFWKLFLCAVFLFFLSIGGYRFTKGFQDWRRNENIKRGYVEEVDRLKTERQRLKREIQNLEHNLLTQERLAREIGYIKPGETVYKFVSKAD